MGITIAPESVQVTASSTSWDDHVDEWHTWFSGSSTHWNVKNFTDDTTGSGDIGFILQPATGTLDFDLCVHFDNQNAAISAALDPDANITDPLDPTGSGGPNTSPEPTGIFDPNPSYQSASLLSTTDESVNIIMKSGSNTATPAAFQGGDIFTPVFSNDPDFGLAGLGYMAAEDRGDAAEAMRLEAGVENDDAIFLQDREDTTNRSQFHLSGTTWARGTVERDSTNYNLNADRTRGRETPMPVPVWDRNNSNTHKCIGVLKYLYVWDQDHNALDRLEGSDNEGYIFLEDDGTQEAHILVPWEQNVSAK